MFKWKDLVFSITATAIITSTAWIIVGFGLAKRSYEIQNPLIDPLHGRNLMQTTPVIDLQPEEPLSPIMPSKDPRELGKLYLLG
jgi:hypothetical protein